MGSEATEVTKGYKLWVTKKAIQDRRENSYFLAIRPVVAGRTEMRRLAIAKCPQPLDSNISKISQIHN